MFVKEISKCCGGKAIVGLPDDELFSTREETLEGLKRYVEDFLKETLHLLRDNAFVLIILNPKQKKVFNTILKKYGFTIIRQKINPKTSHLLTLYSYTDPQYQKKR
mgnify:CR=1 FL=1